VQRNKITVGGKYVLPPVYGRKEKAMLQPAVNGLPDFFLVEGEIEVTEIIRAPVLEKQSLGFVKVKKIEPEGKGEIVVIDAIEFICAINGFPTDKLGSEVIRDLGHLYL
jgi:hypothetical protein